MDPQSSTKRRLALAALTVLLVLVGLELASRAVLAIGGGGLDYEDPFVGFYGLEPIFVPSPDREGWLETNPAKVGNSYSFHQLSFPAEPDAGELRIFCLGGSVTYGFPFPDPGDAYPALVEQTLSRRIPNRPLRVLNLGGNAHASYRLPYVLRDALAAGADIVTIDVGHNEFLEPHFYRAILRRHPASVKARALVGHSAIFRLLNSALVRLRARTLSPESDGVEAANRDMFGKPMFGEEVRTLGIASDPLHADIVGTIDHLEISIRSMVRQAKSAGAIPVLVTAPSNLDWEPAASRPLCAHDPNDARSGAYDAELDRARGAARGNRPTEAIAAFERALDLDPGAARVHWELARQLLERDEIDRAIAELRLARDLDPASVRSISSFNRVIRDVAAQEGALVADVDSAFASFAQASNDPLGKHLFVDHCHPSKLGQRIAAEVVAETIGGGLGDGEQ